MKKQIKHIWSIACQKVIIDSVNHNLSIVDVLENVQASIDKLRVDNKPVGVPLKVYIVSHWRNLDRGKLIKSGSKILFRDPENRDLLVNDFKFEVPKDKSNMRTIVTVDVLPVTISGEYKFIVQQKSGDKYEKVAEIPIDVTISLKEKLKK